MERRRLERDETCGVEGGRYDKRNSREKETKQTKKKNRTSDTSQSERSASASSAGDRCRLAAAAPSDL